MRGTTVYHQKQHDPNDKQLFNYVFVVVKVECVFNVQTKDFAVNLRSDLISLMFIRFTLYV